MKRGLNDVRIDGDVAYLALTNRRGEVVAEAMVDAADLPRLREYGRRWCHWQTNRGYPMVGHKGPAVILARFILGPAEGFLVDHINGNPLDNRRANLRPATYAQNAHNRTPRRDTATCLKGVVPAGKRFRACIRPPGESRPHHLGTFDTPEEAARAYDAAARLLHGAFARPNFTDAPAATPLPLERPA